MTDLSTTNLKRLLEQSTLGPWEYEGAKFQEITTLDHNGLEQSVISLDRYTEKDLCNRPADMNLAAHAPELAEEIIRLREELQELRDQLKKKSECYSKVELSTDPLDGIQLEDNYAEDEISRILGEPDE